MSLDTWWPAQDASLKAPAIGSQFRTLLACRSDDSCANETREALVSHIFPQHIWAAPELISFLRRQQPRLDVVEGLLEQYFYRPLGQCLLHIEQTFSSLSLARKDEYNDYDDDPVERNEQHNRSLAYLERLALTRWVDKPTATVAVMGVTLCETICDRMSLFAMDELVERLENVLRHFACHHSQATDSRTLQVCLYVLVGVAYRFARVRSCTDLRVRCERVLLEQKTLVADLVNQHPTTTMALLSDVLSEEEADETLCPLMLPANNNNNNDASFLHTLVGIRALNAYALQVNHNENWDYDPENLVDAALIRVRREAVLDDTIACFASLPETRLRQILSRRRYRLEFIGEIGVGPGPVHEWLHLLARHLFAPQCATWQMRTEQQGWELTDQARRQHQHSGGETDHTDLVYLSGIVLGLFAVYHLPFPYRLTNGSAHQLLPGARTKPRARWRCLEETDAVLSSQFRRLLALKEDDDDDRDALAAWNIETEDGCAVTTANRAQFIDEYVSERVLGIDRRGRLQLGFGVVLGNSCGEYDALRLLRASELVDFLCGDRASPTTVAEWKRHILPSTVATAAPPEQLVRWFWHAFAALDPEQRCDLVEFVTCSRRPALSLVGGGATFRLCHDTRTSADRLPIARTCFRELHLPPFTSADVCRKRIFEIVALHRASPSFSLA